MFEGAQNLVVKDSTLNNVGRDQINVFNPLPVATSLHDKLGPVDNAGYNRLGQVSKCKPGTRQDLLSVIYHWASKKGMPPICWLKGPAGFGKSAVAQTVAEHYDAKDRLAGGFFFLRGAGSRSTFSHLIATLAYQLSVSKPATKQHIEQVLCNEPTILQHSSLLHQFRRLIIEPIVGDSLLRRVIICSKPFILIVLDALDECDDKKLMAEFIDALIDIMGSQDPPPLRILLTSRVEEHIRKKFDSPKAKAVIHHLELGAFDAQADIRSYFAAEFYNIYEEHHPVMRSISLPWPSARDMQILLEKAGKSFMFAFTLMQMINKSDSPDKQLQVVLQTEEAGLDALYHQVLTSFDHTPMFQRIFGTIMILKDNQSITFLAHLLKLEAKDVVYSLLTVQSIIIIPGDDNEEIQLYHTSLRDFLTTPSHSKAHYINPPLQHILLAIDCLQLLAYESTEYFFNSDAEIYACLHWSHHMLLGLEKAEQILNEDISNSLINFLSAMMFQLLKRWFNTVLLASRNDRLAVLNNLDSVIKLLQKAENPFILKCVKSVSKLAQDVSTS